MYARYFSSETCRSFKRNRTSFEVTFSLKPRRKICLYYKDQLWNTSASNARVLSTRWSRGLKRDPPKPNVISDSEAVEFLGDPSDKDDKVSEFMMKTTTGDDVQAFLSKAEEYEKLLRKPGRFLPKRWHVKELLGKGRYRALAWSSSRIGWCESCLETYDQSMLMFPAMAWSTLPKTWRTKKPYELSRC